MNRFSIFADNKKAPDELTIPDAFLQIPLGVLTCTDNIALPVISVNRRTLY